MKRILLVEDDITMNNMLSNLLLDQGHRVTSACTAEEARCFFGAGSYDLVILSGFMVRFLNRKTLLQRLRETE